MFLCLGSFMTYQHSMGYKVPREYLNVYNWNYTFLCLGSFMTYQHSTDHIVPRVHLKVRESYLENKTCTKYISERLSIVQLNCCHLYLPLPQNGHKYKETGITMVLNNLSKFIYYASKLKQQ